MLVNKNGYLKSTLYPNTNWTGDNNYYIVDETTEAGKALANTIEECAPYMELVLENGQIVDVIPTEKPIPEPEVVVEQVDPEKVAMVEAIIDLETRLRELEWKQNA